jgi:hypothetical protein
MKVDVIGLPGRRVGSFREKCTGISCLFCCFLTVSLENDIHRVDGPWKGIEFTRGLDASVDFGPLC